MFGSCYSSSRKSVAWNLKTRSMKLDFNVRVVKSIRRKNENGEQVEQQILIPVGSLVVAGIKRSNTRSFADAVKKENLIKMLNESAAVISIEDGKEVITKEGKPVDLTDKQFDFVLDSIAGEKQEVKGVFSQMVEELNPDFSWEEFEATKER